MICMHTSPSTNAKCLPTGVVTLLPSSCLSRSLPLSLYCPAVAKGDRIAQLVLECIMTPDVLVVDDLDGTSRGAGGFGSTGGFGGSTAAAGAEQPMQQ